MGDDDAVHKFSTWVVCIYCYCLFILVRDFLRRYHAGPARGLLNTRRILFAVFIFIASYRTLYINNEYGAPRTVLKFKRARGFWLYTMTRTIIIMGSFFCV